MQHLNPWSLLLQDANITEHTLKNTLLFYLCVTQLINEDNLHFPGVHWNSSFAKIKNCNCQDLEYSTTDILYDRQTPV